MSEIRPIEERILQRLEEIENNHKSNTSWLYRYRHLLPFLTAGLMVAGILLGTYIGYATQTEKVTNNQSDITTINSTIKVLESNDQTFLQFIAEQRARNEQFNRMVQEVSDIHMYLMGEKKVKR